MTDHDRDNAAFDRRYRDLRKRARWSGYVRSYAWIVVLLILALFLLWLVALGVDWGMV